MAAFFGSTRGEVTPDDLVEHGRSKRQWSFRFDDEVCCGDRNDAQPGDRASIAESRTTSSTRLCADMHVTA
jgi:hypothetical protein